MGRLTLLLSVGFLILLLGIGGVAWYVVGQLAPVSDGTTPITVTITSGESVEAIGEKLKNAGLLRSTFAFSVAVWAEGVAEKLQAGEYSFVPAMDAGAIVRALAAGEDTGREITIRILEGWSIVDIGRYLVEEKRLFSFSDWEAAVQVTDSRDIIPDADYPFLADKPSTATLEGYLYPDTYRVFRNAAPAEVLQKMLENFGKKIDSELQATIAGQGRTLFDVLTLASILESEVQTDADRKLAADVFLKRLRDGIPLQSDATVNFITGKGRTRSSLEDIAVDSPYNTYKYQGLPPGPIANPSLSSITAAVDPEPNPYYFFLTTESGQTIFSRTFEEHVANKSKYLGP